MSSYPSSDWRGGNSKSVPAYVLPDRRIWSSGLEKCHYLLSEELTAHFAGKAEVAILHGKMKSDEICRISKRERRISWFRHNGYWGWGQCSQCDRHDYCGCRSVPRSQPTSPVRGRVGRGSASPMLFSWLTQDGFWKDRMRIMTETTNGFTAEEDLKMRGSGEISTRQSGLPEFQVAGYYRRFDFSQPEKVASYISSIEAGKSDPSGAWLLSIWKERTSRLIYFFENQIQTINVASRIYVTDFVSLIYNLKSSALSNLRLVS